MRRTTSLTTAALTALVLLGPAGAAAPAAAAGETCRGEAATIVGDRGKDIVGTAGRDVVVTNRSQDVATLGGDDLVCVTGPDSGDGSLRPVTVDTGPGNDVVDGTAAPSWPIDGYLGTGSDRFEGGAGGDSIYAGPPSWDDVEDVDDEVDVLIGGAGSDSLSGGTKGLPNSDVLHGGDGNDGLHAAGILTDAALLDGGAESDAISLSLATGDNTLSNDLPGDAGELRRGAETAVRWTSIERFYVTGPESGGASVSITGNPLSESFSVYDVSRVVADLGAGDDELNAFDLPSAGSAVEGGSGRDSFAVGSEDHALAWNMAEGPLRVGDAWTFSATGFEDGFLAAPKVVVRGTDEDNSLWFASCDVTARGLGGDDRFRLGADHVWESYKSCGGDTVMAGGAGDDTFTGYGDGVDRLRGGPGNDEFVAKGGRDTVLAGPGRDTATMGHDSDRFVGGPGKDRVDGEGGRDRCVAERERRCER